MILKTVYVRFYKSFNFDYLRKFDDRAGPQPWEQDEPSWFPFVRIPIDRQVTTIVGANESGKSHLLSAIGKGLTGDGIAREDFCRYSQFFTVVQGELRLPDFGFEWGDLTEDDRRGLQKACALAETPETDRFFLFRTSQKRLTAYLPLKSGCEKYTIPPELSQSIAQVLPAIIAIDAEVALPDSVPIRWLAAGQAPQSPSPLVLGRRKRDDLLQSLETFMSHPEWYQTKETVAASANQIAPAMSSLMDVFGEASTDRTMEHKQFSLAHDLICKVARVDKEMLAELSRGLSESKDGYANGIIQKINDQLASHLDFPHWWAQDRHFRLTVSARDQDLVFTIRDRTETEYSFNERSSGLKYFLSYYIQYLAHEPKGERPEILLMDEPDHYLSSQAQQDLLKIFGSFAAPEDPQKRPVQVIYVTHSPFLVDKNHADRVRVLEKGVGDEGTRVVRDASKNHYEPLRSAFGSFLGETTFIGNCNLMVEGLADQILLAGASSYLQNVAGVSDLERLDLNHITIVPAGSAGHIPYMVYLARGRDVERPATIVLLDSDLSGNEARAGLKRGGAKNKQLIRPDLILQVGELDEVSAALAPEQRLLEIEDLIPLSLLAAAAQLYLYEICNIPTSILAELDETCIQSQLRGKESHFDALKAAVSGLASKHGLDATLHVDKVGLARIVIDIVQGRAQRGGDAVSISDDVRGHFIRNMRALFSRLRAMQRIAERELTEDRVSRKIDRLKTFFLNDHPGTARREQAIMFLQDLEAALDDTPESDAARVEIARLRKDFKLTEELTKPILEYDTFRTRLETIKYAGLLATQEAEATPDRSATTKSVKPEDSGSGRGISGNVPPFSVDLPEAATTSRVESPGLQSIGNEQGEHQVAVEAPASNNPATRPANEEAP